MNLVNYQTTLEPLILVPVSSSTHIAKKPLTIIFILQVPNSLPKLFLNQASVRHHGYSYNMYLFQIVQ
jgi:hypothetical protein